MRHEFVLPQVGMGMTEGHVISWNQEVGSLIERDQPLVVVETEKVEVEIEAPISGTLVEILVHPETTVDVGTVLAYIETVD